MTVVVAVQVVAVSACRRFGVSPFCLSSIRLVAVLTCIHVAGAEFPLWPPGFGLLLPLPLPLALPLALPHAIDSLSLALSAGVVSVLCCVVSMCVVLSACVLGYQRMNCVVCMCVV